MRGEPLESRVLKLVYIYGPPAAGKLTIAIEVARLTGFKLFHNHLTIAAVEPIFEFGTDAFWQLVHQFREAVFAAAAVENVDLIFTNVYTHPTDSALARRRFDIVEAREGKVCLVQLTCDVDELESRLGSPHRFEMGKLADVETFRADRRTKDVFSSIPGRHSLSIDTTNLSPEDAAMRIIRHYRLMGDEIA